VQDFRGKVAVITGGASGIGRAIAEALIAEGARIVLADIEESALATTAAELSKGGAEVHPVPTDVTQSEQLVALADAAESRFGATHLVFNNAGVAPIGLILETRIEDFRWVLEVNVLGVAHGIAAFGPRLVAQGEGHIVNTASSAGLVTVPGFGAYIASKHAVVGLSETLYQELLGTGVGVSVLCPGLVTTRIFESERNRPGDGGPSDYGDAGQAAQAALATMGMAPSEIAVHVLRAIRENRMYILPSPEVRPVLEERFRRILAGENPQSMGKIDEA
jgi:NAD(P)-dependent dehydrogenase (short-subunit alcohol dehydrogenase family)